MFDNLGESKVDIDRDHLKGYPEIVYGLHKTAGQIARVMQSLLDHDKPVLVTRVAKEKWEAIGADFPQADYQEAAQTITIGQCEKIPHGKMVILNAGTSDFPVSEEARVTAEWMGCQVTCIYDVGVAGIHRLLSYQEEIRQANVLVVVAGMEGALPSVVSGLVEAPVIAVPTSVGYGANLEGITTLLAMITSCSSGISVVNIDNGFGGAYQGALFLKQISQFIKERD